MRLASLLREALKDRREVGSRFALAGLMADGGRLTSPIRLLARSGARSAAGGGETSCHCGPREPIVARHRNSDFDVLRQIFRDREYDLSLFPAAFQRLDAARKAMIDAGVKPVIVDAGANIGAASRWFREQFPGAAVVAIEPDPGNAAVLRRNLAGCADAVVMEAAIGAETGHVALTCTEGDGWGVRTERTNDGIPVVTVNDAVAAVPNGELLMVKVDIEGFEIDLFARNTGWLARTHAVLIEPHDWMLPGKGTSRSFQRAMAEHDFEMLLRGENLFYVRP